MFMKEQTRRLHVISVKKKFTLRRLKRHIKGVHERRKDNLCKICNKFLSDEWISKHIKTVHKKIKNSGKCEYCEKSLENVNIAKNHFANHII